MDKEKEIKKQNSLRNLKRFWKDKPVPIPSPESKSAGRERKREAMRIMNDMIKYQDMTLDEFQNYIESNKKELKLWNIITATRMKEIMKDKNMMKYRIDKHVPNAPVQQEISWVDWWSIDIEWCANASIEDLLNLLKTK